MKTVADTIRQAVDLAPASARALALEAGIDPSLLIRIISGEKGLTPETAVKLHDALIRWRDRCAEAAALIRSAYPQRGRTNG